MLLKSSISWLETVFEGEKFCVSKRGHKMKKNVLGICLCVVVLAGCSGGTKSKETVESSSAYSIHSTEKTSQADKTIETYDGIVKEAKELNVAGKFKESELKLATIPVSVLSNEKYSTLKEIVEKLSNTNNQGIQKEEDQQKTNQTPANGSSNSASNFTGELAKWANTYVFYYLLDGQKQSRLTIAGNGGVTQSNYDGTQYFGMASIISDETDVLSYNTNTMYPSNLPATKMIHSNVTITIQWDNGGGNQVYYGYLSNSSRLILTDGMSQNKGVHEVWVTY